jgi:RAT1-interacting protein
MTDRFGGTYVPMDVCKMQFRNDIFQCVIDKGTLDALMCHTHFEVAVSAMMLEISRVLAPNGVFIEVTFGQTAQRIDLLDSPSLLHWTLDDTITVNAPAGTVSFFVFRKFKEIIHEKCHLGGLI